MRRPRSRPAAAAAPPCPRGRARAMRAGHDYDRGGALAYLAAWDVRRGQVTGRCEDTTGIAPFARLVEQVMTTEPYASAGRVFWITDNGSSHRGAAAAERMASAWPAAHADPPARARLLAGPGGNLLLRRSSAKSSRLTTSPAWTRSAAASPRSRPATTPSPGHLPGSSPAPTSATCCAGSMCTTRPSPTPWQPDHHGPSTNLRVRPLSLPVRVLPRPYRTIRVLAKSIY